MQLRKREAKQRKKMVDYSDEDDESFTNTVMSNMEQKHHDEEDKESSPKNISEKEFCKAMQKLKDKGTKV